MYKTTVALGSFIVGACSVLFAVSLTHTSTRVQADQVGMAVGGAEPVVPQLMAQISDSSFGAGVIALDGIDCFRCTIKASAFTYGGGAFNCTECTLPANIPIVLRGAALNTLRVLVAFKALPSEPKPPQFALPAPRIDKASAPQMTRIITLVSLEGIKK